MVITFYGKAGAKKHKDTNTSQVELELERIRELPEAGNGNGMERRSAEERCGIWPRLYLKRSGA
jgi:hypothetical protein